MLRNGYTLNCPCTAKDDEIAHNIFSLDAAAVRGRKLCPPQLLMLPIALEDIPDEVRSIHKQVRLHLDVMLISKIPF